MVVYLSLKVNVKRLLDEIVGLIASQQKSIKDANLKTGTSFQRCHVALNISEMENALDLRKEAISTLLVQAELYSNHTKLRILPPIMKTVKLKFYRRGLASLLNDAPIIQRLLDVATKKTLTMAVIDTLTVCHEIISSFFIKKSDVLFYVIIQKKNIRFSCVLLLQY